MIFKRLLATGFAVAAGLMASQAQAQALTTIWYNDSDSTPKINLSITDLGFAYELTLSTLAGTGSGDFLGFGFDYALQPPVIESATGSPSIVDDGIRYIDSTDPLTIGDISYISAFNAPGFDSDNPLDNKLSDTGIDNELDALYAASELCANTVTITPSNQFEPGGITTCGPGNNINGGNVNSEFDYLLNIGDQGTPPGTGVDEITFQIAAPAGGTANLLTANPFSNLTAARLQTTGTSETEGGDESVKSPLRRCVFGTPDCGVVSAPPLNEVPEIDGPVLIQVGFALGGLYLLLLGRRREEDELAHAA